MFNAHYNKGSIVLPRGSFALFGETWDVRVDAPSVLSGCYRVWGCATAACNGKVVNVQMESTCTSVKQAYKVACSYARQLSYFIQDCKAGLPAIDYQVFFPEPHGAVVSFVNIDGQLAEGTELYG